MRVFVEFASSEMQLMFDEQIRIYARFDSFKIANAITLLYRHFDDNVVVSS